MPKKKKYTARRRTSSSAVRNKRLVRPLLCIVLLVAFLPLFLTLTLWWQDRLPTRAELPRWRERILLMLSDWRYPRLPEGEVCGIDISHYQGTVRWEELAFHTDATRRLYARPNRKTEPRKVHFVFAKATEGVHYRDPYYQRNKQGARAAGILFGAYHFYSPAASARLQADNFIRTACLHAGDLIPVLDVEPVSGRLPDADSVLCWLRTVERYYRVRPIVYTNEHCRRAFFLSRPEFERYPFWVARYGGAEPSLTHAFWQSSENGRVGGVSGTVDLNLFRGTPADLLYLYTLKGDLP